MSLLCFFGHHRSASSWANDILRTIAVTAGWRYQKVHNAAMFDHDLPKFIRHTQPDLLTFTNAKSEYLPALPPFKGFHLIRDPRDVLVSSYFSHRNSHPTNQWPELIPHRAKLRACSKALGLMLELICRREEFTDMLHWPYDLPHIYEMKMEVMVKDPITYFLKLFSFWDRLQESMDEAMERRQITINKTRVEKVWPWLIEEIVTANAFQKKSGGRAIGETNENHHYRAGVAGDWQTHFYPALTQRFKSEYNEVLVKLGYESFGEVPHAPKD